MEIETVSDLCEYLADLVGVYGGCKHADKSVDSECPEKLVTCCRIGFVTEISERIRKAVENEKMLSAMDERKYGLRQSSIPDVNIMLPVKAKHNLFGNVNIIGVRTECSSNNNLMYLVKHEGEYFWIYDYETEILGN